MRSFFEKLDGVVSQKRYDVERIQVSGDSAVVEGVENYARNGRTVRLHCVSTFLFAVGKIREWRDSFDMQTVLHRLDLPLDGSRPAR